MRYDLPVKLTNSVYALNELSKLNEQLLRESTTKIYWTKTIFVQPNILAILGLMIYQAKCKQHKVSFHELSLRVSHFLAKYQFIQSSVTSPTHFFTTSKFNKDEQTRFEMMINLKLAHLSDEIRRYLTSRLLILFELANQSECLYVSGYCNLNEDWYYVTFAYDETLFSCKEALEEAQKTGTILGQQHLLFSMLLNEVDELGGKWFLGGSQFLYESKTKLFHELTGTFQGTFITVFFPLSLMSD